MFETAELGRKLDKERYKEKSEELRTELLQVQRQLEQRSCSVIVLINGVDGAGKGDVVNLINEWMDARNIQTLAFDEPVEEERHRPPFWRYWMALPPAGSIAVVTGAWYTQPILMRVYGKATDHDLDAAMVRINAFEKTLVENGTLLIKLWLHISKATQKKTFKKLEKNPQTKFRVTKRDWKHAKLYDTFRPVCERAIRETSTGEAPWLVVESGDRRYRRVTVAQHLVERIQRRIDAPPKPTPVPPSPIDDPETILDTLDLKASIDRADYSDAIEKQQARLAKLARKARAGNIGVMLVFEGVDAAGKGGAIRRIIEPLDARQYRVIRIAAPTDEEKARHYLWRFWRHLPRLGRFTIYDRSWYGRVLVERIEGFAGEAEWMRAYKEINDFEEQLVEFGIVLVKFWLHISRDEQLTRFQLREKTPWKQYKITEEDYRNREKANLYELCANDMVSRTSTEYALWTLIPSEDKRYARVKVLETVCERLEGALAR